MSLAVARSGSRIARGLLVGGALLHAFGPGAAEAQAPPYPASAGFVASDSPDRWNAIGGGNAVAIALGGTVTFDVATGEAHDASFEPSSGAACSVAGGQFTTRIPPAPAAAWSGNCTFSQPGYHAFVCTVHRGMTGEVAVAGADGTLPARTGETPPPAAPSPPPAGPTTSPPADAATLRPLFTLEGRQRGAVVRGSIANAGPAATATIDISARRRDLSTARRAPAAASGCSADAPLERRRATDVRRRAQPGGAPRAEPQGSALDHAAGHGPRRANRRRPGGADARGQPRGGCGGAGRRLGRGAATRTAGAPADRRR